MIPYFSTVGCLSMHFAWDIFLGFGPSPCPQLGDAKGPGPGTAPTFWLGLGPGPKDVFHFGSNSVPCFGLLGTTSPGPRMCSMSVQFRSQFGSMSVSDQRKLNPDESYGHKTTAIINGVVARIQWDRSRAPKAEKHIDETL